MSSRKLSRSFSKVAKVGWKQCLAIKRLGLRRYGLQLKMRRLGLERPGPT